MRLEYFQMIDRVVDLDAAKRRVRCRCNVPETSPVFEGHFPTYPILPGVLLIECMAQTGGLLANALTGFVSLPILAAVKNAKFRAVVRPGDVLEFEAGIEHEGSGYTIADTTGSRDGATICEARLTYRLIPYPTEELRQKLLADAEKRNVAVKDFAKEFAR